MTSHDSNLDMIGAVGNLAEMLMNEHVTLLVRIDILCRVVIQVMLQTFVLTHGWTATCIDLKFYLPYPLRCLTASLLLYYNTTTYYTVVVLISLSSVLFTFP
jgi:hypothetical protein